MTRKVRELVGPLAESGGPSVAPWVRDWLRSAEYRAEADAAYVRVSCSRCGAEMWGPMGSTRTWFKQHRKGCARR